MRIKTNFYNIRLVSQKGKINMENEKILFVGDIYTNKSINIDLPREDIVVYNQEYVVGNQHILTPSENKVNLISESLCVKQLFKKSKHIFGNISNNHIKDYGKEGLNSTLLEMQKEGVFSFGEAADNQSRKSYRISKKQVSFLGYYMSAFTKEDEITEIISRLESDIKTAKDIADLVFVIFHFGNEHYPYASKEQQRVAHAAIDYGAEMVVGHHSHCIQNIEKYKSKMIFYSVGNFYFPNFVVDAFYSNGKPQVKFVWRNTVWTNKGLAVLYSLQNGNIEVFQTKNCRGKILLKKRNINKLIKKGKIKRTDNINRYIGELRKVYLNIKCNLFVEGKFIYFEGISFKLNDVKNNGRFSHKKISNNNDA